MSDTINILCIIGLKPQEKARIEALDPRIRITEGAGWFDGEMRATWPAEAGRRYINPNSDGKGTRAERNAMLASADIVVVSYPFPMDIRARGTRVKWVHQRPAGANNMTNGDLWGSDIPVTTSRGFAASVAIAEFAVAGYMHFAKELHRTFEDRVNCRMERSAYHPVLIAGKTALVVGAGGIGRAVGRLAKGLDMRVIGTRRDPDGPLPEGFDAMHRADELLDLLPRADFVAICCQWTPETENLFDAKAFAAMKDDAVLANVARGEIVDEAALIETLEAGRLKGVATDVYIGEFEGPPDERLWDHPRVLITPHSSGVTDGPGGSNWIEVFCRNLQRFLKDEPLENVIDWERGY